MIQKIVIFELNEQQYGVNVNEIQSIEHVTTFTPIPQVEHYFKGIIHLRGEVIPVIDLKLKLNMPATTVSNLTKIIVTKIEDLFIGFLVDEARDVLDINVENLESPTELTGESKLFVEGVIKLDDVLILLVQLKNIIEGKDIAIVRDLLKTR